MKIVGVNGFGRIGRYFTRMALESSEGLNIPSLLMVINSFLRMGRKFIFRRIEIQRKYHGQTTVWKSLWSLLGFSEQKSKHRSTW